MQAENIRNILNNKKTTLQQQDGQSVKKDE